MEAVAERAVLASGERESCDEVGAQVGGLDDGVDHQLRRQPQEVDVGIITAFIGAPVFIWIVRRTKLRAL